MATLTNPINAQNIVDRFADYVVATANANIVWTNTNKPFAEANAAAFSTGSGKTISVDGTDITPASGIITKTNIYYALIAETARYTSIRKIRARLIITTGSGNRTRAANTGFDQTAVAHMSGTGYQGTITSVPALGAKPSVADLQTFFTNLRDKYTAQRNATQTYSVSVCHSSCHSSCHNSRGRR
jgi:hypothetical protein